MKMDLDCVCVSVRHMGGGWGCFTGGSTDTGSIR